MAVVNIPGIELDDAACRAGVGSPWQKKFCRPARVTPKEYSSWA